jgi:hypothetical protein
MLAMSIDSILKDIRQNETSAISTGLSSRARICAWAPCGKTFTPKVFGGGNSKYCCDRHKMRAYRERKALRALLDGATT